MSNEDTPIRDAENHELTEDKQIEQSENPSAPHIDLANPDDPDEKELRDNPYIYSQTEPVGPNSFVDYRQPSDKKSPPPKYFDESVLLEPLPTCKEDIMKGLKEMEYGGLQCVDKEAMER